MTRYVLILIIVLANIASRSLAQETSLYMNSEPGDYIGQGLEWFYSPDTAEFSANQVNGHNGVHIGLWITNPEFGWWDLYFTAQSGQQLEIGEYDDATRWPFNEPSEPGLSVSGMGRGCNTLTGSFEIYEVVFGAGNTVESFRATFEQHCEGLDPALYGDVRYNATGGVPTLEIRWGDLKQTFR